MEPRIGALVVGQSPRLEIDEEFQRLAKGSAQLVVKGALDGAVREEALDASRNHTHGNARGIN